MVIGDRIQTINGGTVPESLRGLHGRIVELHDNEFKFGIMLDKPHKPEVPHVFRENELIPERGPW